jgi:serine/threonine protein kinase
VSSTVLFTFHRAHKVIQVAIKLLSGVHTDPEVLQQVTRVKPSKQEPTIVPLTGINQRLKRETRVWYCLSDKNVMPFFGLCNDLGPSAAMISPLYDNSDMIQYFKKTPGADRQIIVSLTAFGENGVSSLLQITGVAHGLKYLHSKDIVHGDLKPVKPFVVSAMP